MKAIRMKSFSYIRSLFAFFIRYATEFFETSSNIPHARVVQCRYVSDIGMQSDIVVTVVG